MSFEHQPTDPLEEHRIDSFALQRDTIQQALRLMADYLASRDQNITIITVGGSISNILLRDQLTREHLDYLVLNVSDEQRRIFADAARHTRNRCSRPIVGAWFSARGDDTLKLPSSICRQVVLSSISQNEVIFQAPGLKIIAAPWDYAFVATLGRLASDRSPARRYDLCDAIAYLHRYIQVRWDGPLTMDHVDFCARSYGILGVESTAWFVASRYRLVHGCDGIVKSPLTGHGRRPV